MQHFKPDYHIIRFYIARSCILLVGSFFSCFFLSQKTYIHSKVHCSIHWFAIEIAKFEFTIENLKIVNIWRMCDGNCHTLQIFVTVNEWMNAWINELTHFDCSKFYYFLCHLNFHFFLCFCLFILFRLCEIALNTRGCQHKCVRVVHPWKSVSFCYLRIKIILSPVINIVSPN